MSPLAAMAIGLLAGGVCFWAVSLKFRFGYDDSLDVVGGPPGRRHRRLARRRGLRLRARSTRRPSTALIGGGPELLFKQIVAVAVVLVFSFTTTYALAQVVKRIAGLRVDEESETHGLDISVHDERGYALVD